MKKSTLTGLLYAFLSPINVWAGYELGIENYPYAVFLIVVLMFIEFYSVKLWIEAQTEDIKCQ